MSTVDEWFAGPIGSRRAIAVGALAISLGVILISLGLFVEGPLMAKVFQGFFVGVPLVIGGVWAFRRPSEMPRVLGGLVGALSAPLYLPLFAMSHPWVEDAAGNPRTSWLEYRLARCLGAGALIVGLLILWQAHQGASSDPEIARWEFVHPGVVPAIPIALLAVCTALLPSRFPIMCGAMVGAFPALACSALLIDPNPDNHGRSTSTLVAYTLPLTLPITVGLGGMLGNYLHRMVAGSRQ